MKNLSYVEKGLTAALFVGYFLFFPPYISRISYRDHKSEEMYRMNHEQFLDGLEEYMRIERMRENLARSAGRSPDIMRPSDKD